MGIVIHTGFMTYLMIAIIVFVGISFVSPETAHQILDHLHSLMVVLKA